MTPTAISWAAKPSAVWETFFAFIAAPLTPLRVTEGTNSCLFFPKRTPLPLCGLPIALPSGSAPMATSPLHQRKTMPRKVHPWGAPPWTVDFRPASRALPDHVDFAIVGGGFSGLSAAAWLCRLAPGRSVLVLESASLGEGASGRTGGMALAETAAGNLAGLGDVLAGYRKILRVLRIDSRLTLPGVWELSRSRPAKKHSAICWSDS